MEHFTTNITYLIFQEMMTCYLKPFFVPDHCVFQTDELMKRLRLMDMCNKQMGHRSVEKAIMQEHRLQFSTLIQEDTEFIQKKSGIAWNKKSKWVCHHLHCLVTGFQKD